MNMGMGVGLTKSLSVGSLIPGVSDDGLLIYIDTSISSNHYEDTAQTTPSSGANGRVNWVADVRGLPGVGIEASPVTGAMYFPASMWRRGSSLIIPGFVPLSNCYGEVKLKGVTISDLTDFTLVVIGRNGTGTAEFPLLENSSRTRHIADTNGGYVYTQPGFSGADAPGHTGMANTALYILSSNGSQVVSRKDVRTVTITGSLTSDPLVDPFFFSNANYQSKEFQVVLLYDRQLTSDERTALQTYAQSYGYDPANFGSGRPIITGLADAQICGGFGNDYSCWWLEVADEVEDSYRIIPVFTTAGTYLDAPAYIIATRPAYVAGSKYFVCGYTYYDIVLPSGTAAQIFAGWKTAIDSAIAAGWDTRVYLLTDMYTFPNGTHQALALAVTALMQAEYPTILFATTPKSADDGVHFTGASHVVLGAEVLTEFGL